MQPDTQAAPNRRNVIVMVDDDTDDLYLAAEAIDTVGVPIEFRALGSGTELMDYLERRGKFSAPSCAPRPDLVLLDLNMPLMDGLATLNMLRTSEAFRDIPVIIFSTSTAPTDIHKSYLGGANTYIAKPHSFDALCETMQKLSEYWFDTAERADGPG